MNSQPDPLESKPAIGHDRLAVVVLAGSACLMATGPILASVAMRQAGMGPFGTAFWRFAIAAPLLIVLAVAGRRRSQEQTPFVWPKTFARWLYIGGPGAALALVMGAWFTAMLYTTAAAATIMTNMQAPMVGLAAWVLFGQRPRWLFFAGTCIAIVGVVGLLIAEPGPITMVGGNVTGDLIALIGAVAYAAYLLQIARLSRSYKPAEVIAMAASVAAVLLLPLPALLGEPYLPGNATGWWSLVGMSLVAQVFGHSALGWAVARVSSAASASVLLVQPVATAILGWLVLHELLDAWQIGAIGVILVGVFLAKRGAPATQPDENTPDRPISS
ncbi:DMT family transporter [Gimesia sp.]|uniref:DMT family transporter n=1 Tax=Gimesia sp. TaxID=2024833 RepID=UPI003A92A8DC